MADEIATTIDIDHSFIKSRYEATEHHYKIITIIYGYTNRYNGGMISLCNDNLKIAKLILNAYKSNKEPLELLEKLNQLPYHPKSAFYLLKVMCLSNSKDAENAVKPVKVGYSWRSPVFNLRKQSSFIETSHALGLNPYSVHPELRSIAFPTAPLPIKPKDKTKNYDLDNIEKFKKEYKLKQKAKKRPQKSPLQGKLI